ncbi:regulator of cell morphogenesis and NO signaling [Cnuella takakiae]|uniref:Regulator of cell morphogenesis and NO signaling n=1 Tax=Cnuella takakiae TaxID=1302690 RepID=A0A1M4XAJ5_9BACT|nr:iron-sulfur cluster repair di-iron protein [Cnuella takakiae]OLY91484.1 iron-sulfur cluster repair di-iron protein [Cnuella takakiae]SHE90425.1 regulator of cell morphogenesis and NO signaling [Cnuella takakiae]
MPVLETPFDSEILILNVTVLEPRMKHPTIFQQFDALAQGDAFRILNDHDPKPLYYQMIAERGNIFSWQYLEQGPQRWIVEIKKHAPGETVGELAAKDVRKAEVFKKYGIDFCCGGKKSLAQACAEAGVSEAEVAAALENAGKERSVADTAAFNRWDADFLADYIYNQHHNYYYEEGPVLNELVDKVTARHSDHAPELKQVQLIWRQLSAELNTHFLKEERIVFPFIKALVKARKTGDLNELQAYPSIQEPIQVMESDHEAAGDLLAALRKLTNGFTPPQGACNSFQLLYQKLADLEADLHQHIHLENNILFPKGLQLERDLRTALTA